MDPVAYVEKRYGIVLKHVSGDEYQGPCPWCGGENRFHVWRDVGNFWCRPADGHCGKSGWVDNIDGQRKYTKEELAILRLQSQQRELERKQQEHERRLTALEKMKSCTDHIEYYNTLKDDDIGLALWRNEGFSDRLIDEYQLGICYECPTSPDKSSLTIPVLDSNWTRLLNIRHRLIGVERNKYRPHMSGLGLQLFNSRWVKSGTQELCVVEGAKKSIIVSDNAISTVGIFGTGGFNLSWLKHFTDIKTLYIALDPDAYSDAVELAKSIVAKSRIQVSVCNFPVKPDDFFTQYDGTKDRFMEYLKLARPIKKT